MIEYESGVPRCTKDGVTILKNLATVDNKINIGLDLLKKVAHNTNKYAGDGTTTSTILASSIFTNGMKYLKAGFNPVLMQRGIIKGQKVIQEYIKSIAIRLDYQRDLHILKQVAVVALNNEQELATLVSDVIHNLGPYGNTHFEPNDHGETSLNILDGMYIGRGYSSDGFLKKVTDSAILMNDAYVLLLNLDVKDMSLILPAIKHAVDNQKPIFIIAKNLSEEILSQLTFQRKRNMVNVSL